MSGKYLGVEAGRSTDAVGSVAVFELDTPVAMVGSN